MTEPTNRGPVSASAAFDIEFNDTDTASKVNDLIQSGMRFQQALDLLELRPNEHYTVTRTDQGPDAQG